MARTAYVLGKLHKAGFEVSGPDGASAQYTATLVGSNTTVRFFGRNGEYDDAHNFYVKPDHMDDDIMADYWAGTFLDNIAQVIHWIERQRESNLAYSA